MLAVTLFVPWAKCPNYGNWSIWGNKWRLLFKNELCWKYCKTLGAGDFAALSGRRRGPVQNKSDLKSWDSNNTCCFIQKEALTCKCLSIALKCTLNDETTRGKSNKIQAPRVHLVSAFSEAWDQRTSFSNQCILAFKVRVVKEVCQMSMFYKWISPCRFVKEYS